MDQVQRFEWTNRWRTRSEGHPYDVALLVAEGSLTFDCGGAAEVVAPSLYVIPAGMPHGLLDCHGASGWAFAGSPRTFGVPCAHRPVPLTARGARSLITSFALLQEEHAEPLPFRSTAMTALRTLIHVEIVRACTASGDGRPSGLVAAALDAVDALAHGPVKPRDVARLVGVTPSHLSHEVSRRTGRTVGRWIAEARVMRVRELLVTSTRTLAEIAEELSYSDVSQLSREFRGVTGMAPGQWRAKTANENARTALGAGASRR